MNTAPTFRSRATKFLTIWIIGAAIYAAYAVITRIPPDKGVADVINATVLGIFASAAYKFIDPD